MFNRYYGFFSLGIIELGNFFTNCSNLLSIGVIILQMAIAVLTIIKLYKDLKTKNKK